MAFEVDPDGLRAAGEELALAGEAFNAALESLGGQLSSLGEPWGADTLGTLVGISFPVISDYLRGCCTAVAEESMQSGDDLVTMAEAYELADSESETLFRNLSARLA